MSPEWRDRLRDRSNPKLDHGIDFIKCYECGKIIAPSEVVDSKYCSSCAEIHRKVEKGYKKCLGCDDYFPPSELYEGKYCSKCKEKLVLCDLCSSEFFRDNERVVCPSCFGENARECIKCGYVFIPEQKNYKFCKYCFQKQEPSSKDQSPELDNKNWTPNNDYQKALNYIGSQKWNELINLETQAAEAIIRSFNKTESEVKIKLLDCLGVIGGEESVDFIVKLIEETDDDIIIRKSLLALGEIKADESLEPILDALEYGNWNIRTSALKSLSNFENEKVLNTISNSLKDSNFIVREFAADILSEKDWKPRDDIEKTYYLIACKSWDKLVETGFSEEVVIESLSIENTEIKKKLLQLLSKSNTDIALKEITKYINDDNSDIKIEVVNILGNMGSEELLDLLIDALQDPNPKVKVSILDVLSKWDYDYVENNIIMSLDDKSLEVKLKAASILTEKKSLVALKPLFELLGNEDKQITDFTISTIINYGSLATEPLIELLNHPNSVIRSNTAIILGEIRDLSALNPLINALGDGNTFVREKSAIALGKLGDKKAISPLVALLSDFNAFVRKAVVKSLGMIGDESVIDFLMIAAHDENGYVRKEAILSLGYIGGEKALVSLTKSISDQNGHVRAAVAESLGILDDERSVPHLIKLLSDKNKHVAIQARNSLTKIGSEKSIDFLIKSLESTNDFERSNAASALGKIGDQKAIKPLIISLRDENSFVRSNAAKSLGQILPNNSSSSLLSLLKDDNNYVRANAAVALGNIGDKNAVASLTFALNDEDNMVRSNAALALGKIGAKDKKAVSSLIQLLKYQDFRICSSAATALGEIGDVKTIGPMEIIMKQKRGNTRQIIEESIERIRINSI